MNDNIWQAAKNTFEIESDAVCRSLEALDSGSFTRTVELLKNAPRIAASGCGHSGILCRHFAHLMCCIERPARFLSPAEAVHGGTGFLMPGDVILFASRGGKTAELLPIMDICHKHNVHIITMTENLSSPLAVGADVVLGVRITRETDRWNSQGTTSFTVMSVLCDALQAALIEETGFRNEEFAVIHPGGAVGERLNKSSK